jgi:hypothetical protein
MFRPVLDWPDAEGWWWMKQVSWAGCAEHGTRAPVKHPVTVVFLSEDRVNEPGSDNYFSREDFGDAILKFVRCEPSPFTN